MKWIISSYYVCAIVNINYGVRILFLIRSQVLLPDATWNHAALRASQWSATFFVIQKLPALGKSFLFWLHRFVFNASRIRSRIMVSLVFRYLIWIVIGAVFLVFFTLEQVSRPCDFPDIYMNRGAQRPLIAGGLWRCPSGKNCPIVLAQI